jgi:Methionine aminopeptidase
MSPAELLRGHQVRDGRLQDRRYRTRGPAVRRELRHGGHQDYTGHGTGTKLHEDPYIPNYGRPGKGARIERNMTLAIEPMIALGSYE